MNVSLTPELDSYIQDKVQTGMYHSASEVVRDGLRLLIEQDRLREIKIEELRRDLKVGIDQLKNGEFTTYDDNSLKGLAEEIKSEGRAKKYASANPQS